MSAHVLPKSIYYTIFGSLMVLTAITVAVSFVNLGSFNFPIAIGVAITKATLVVLFFMHVKYSSRMTKMVVGLALFFLLTMLGLTMTDYLTRGWFSSPRGSTGAGTEVTITHDGGTLRPSNQPARGATAAPAPAPAEHAPAEPAR
jgi:cytochrome c oxidase subunit 4